MSGASSTSWFRSTSWSPAARARNLSAGCGSCLRPTSTEDCVWGVFITFEGPEGAGKSTQVELLRAALADRQPVVTREPGGTGLGERVRDLLLHADVGMAPETEMLL